MLRAKNFAFLCIHAYVYIHREIRFASKNATRFDECKLHKFFISKMNICKFRILIHTAREVPCYSLFGPIASKETNYVNYC